MQILIIGGEMYLTLRSLHTLQSVSVNVRLVLLSAGYTLITRWFDYWVWVLSIDQVFA